MDQIVPFGQSQRTNMKLGKYFIIVNNQYFRYHLTIVFGILTKIWHALISHSLPAEKIMEP